MDYINNSLNLDDESFSGKPIQTLTSSKTDQNKTSDVACLDLLTNVLVSAGASYWRHWNVVDTMPIFGVRVEYYTGRLNFRKMTHTDSLISRKLILILIHIFMLLPVDLRILLISLFYPKTQCYTLPCFMLASLTTYQ